MVNVLPANIIDNMEEGSGSIINQGGRSGSWFTYNDGTGMQTPMAGGQCLPTLIPNGGRCGSLHAMNTFGSGFSGMSYGAGLGFNLNSPATTRMPYDVHTFTGLAFWAMSTSASLQPVQVQVLEQATTPSTPATSGGTCTTLCNDHYHTGVVFPANSWVQVVVPFAMLAQTGFGTKVPWDPTTVLAVQFVVNPATTFNIWVDDVGLY
jgi:hypothetical protein